MTEKAFVIISSATIQVAGPIGCSANLVNQELTQTRFAGYLEEMIK
jgi:hypothetical protein